VTGDLGQRIFQQPFSWKSLGVDIRGRSKTLRVNYRTSHQIRQKADRLLGPVVSDADGNAEDRRHAVSVFNGPPPEVKILGDERSGGGVGRGLARCLPPGWDPAARDRCVRPLGRPIRPGKGCMRERRARLAGAR
jgi:hypothetical protein